MVNSLHRQNLRNPAFNILKRSRIPNVHTRDLNDSRWSSEIGYFDVMIIFHFFLRFIFTAGFPEKRLTDICIFPILFVCFKSGKIRIRYEPKPCQIQGNPGDKDGYFGPIF